MRALILLAAVALSGCAVTYYKNGSTEQEFNIDVAQCEAQSYMVSANGPALDRMAYRMACMKGKGWRTTP